MRPTGSIFPSSANRQIEASKMYTEAIQKLKDMERPLHLTIQEQNQGGPSRKHHKHT
jgi:molybdenum-dependent DNA-binding transcriptional regulator ModE